MIGFAALAGLLTAAIIDPDPTRRSTSIPWKTRTIPTASTIPPHPGEVFSTGLSLEGGAIRVDSIRWPGGPGAGEFEFLRRDIHLGHPDWLKRLLDYLGSLGWTIRRRRLPW